MTGYSVNFNDDLNREVYHIPDLNETRSGDTKPNFQETRPNGVTPVSNLAHAGIELITLEKMNITHQRSSLQRKRWLKQTQSDIFHALELPRTRLAYLYHGFVSLTLFWSTWEIYQNHDV